MPLPLAALLLVAPVGLGVLPGAMAAPKADKPCNGAKCLAPVTPGGVTTEPAAAQPASRGVVADVDSGINPNHEGYYRGPSEATPAVLAEFPGIQALTLTAPATRPASRSWPTRATSTASAPARRCWTPTPGRSCCSSRASTPPARPMPSPTRPSTS